MGITDNNTRPISIWGWNGRSEKEQVDSRDRRHTKTRNRNGEEGDEYSLFQPGGIWDRQMNIEGKPQGKSPKYREEIKKGRGEKVGDRGDHGDGIDKDKSKRFGGEWKIEWTGKYTDLNGINLCI